MISLGCDVGALYTKLVCVDEDRLAAARIVPTTGRIGAEVERLVPDLLAAAGVTAHEVAYFGATGQGAAEIRGADFVEDELSAVAAAVAFYLPETPAALHAGGQSVALVQADAEGRLVHFGRNDKCAAGTGRFIEMMARRLSVDLAAVDALASTAAEPRPVTSQCVVFAESEVIGLANAQVPLPDILAGILGSVGRMVAALGRRAREPHRFTLTGGVGAFDAVARIVAERLQAPVVPFPEPPQLAAALGVALLEEAPEPDPASAPPPIPEPGP